MGAGREPTPAAKVPVRVRGDTDRIRHHAGRGAEAVDKTDRKELSMKEKTITGYTKIVVETDEENPVTIATVDADDIEVVDGYRVRLTPEYD